jgi:hypothetical protein
MYSTTTTSFVFGAGFHFGRCMHLEYRLYYGLTDFAKNLDTPEYGNIESKFITHTINMGFDYYGSSDFCMGTPHMLC